MSSRHRAAAALLTALANGAIFILVSELFAVDLAAERHYPERATAQSAYMAGKIGAQYAAVSRLA